MTEYPRNNRVEPSFEEDLSELLDMVEAGDRIEAEVRLDACCRHLSEFPPDIRERIEEVMQRPLAAVRRGGFAELAEELEAIFEEAGQRPPWEGKR